MEIGKLRKLIRSIRQAGSPGDYVKACLSFFPPLSEKILSSLEEKDGQDRKKALTELLGLLDGEELIGHGLSVEEGLDDAEPLADVDQRRHEVDRDQRPAEARLGRSVRLHDARRSGSFRERYAGYVLAADASTFFA